MPDMLARLLLLERLSDADLALLGGAGGVPGSARQRIARLRDDPERVEELLGDPRVYDSLLEQRREDPFVAAGPFLVFAVLTAHTAAQLEELTFVTEWTGRGRRVPVFEVGPLREFMAEPLRRLFLADLLASYTHVASGPFWVKSRRGWSHRRFSELEPAQVAELILLTPPEQRLVLYRRLGDLALFLTGVFPDYCASFPLAPVTVERLVRAVNDGVVGAQAEPRLPDLGSVALLEWLGRRAYLRAWEAAEHPLAGLSPVLRHVALHFRHARVILNLLTDRYLFEHRERWFPLAS